MAAPLRIFLSSDGVRTLLGQLTFQQIVVGRESPDGFTIPSPAVSREHGIFLSLERHWFFKDLGSTNGTWLNNQKLPPSSLALLKVGDVLQLGDSFLELASAEVGEVEQQRTSVIAFLRDNYIGEYFLPPSGPLLVIGGPKSHLQKEIGELELPGLVIERRGTDLTALTVDPKALAVLNGEPLRHPMKLQDRDIIKLQNYSVHVSLGDELQEYAESTVSIENNVAVFSRGEIQFKDWEDDLPKKAPEKSSFGKVIEEDDVTPSRGSTTILSRKGLLASQEASKEHNIEKIELSFVLGLGALLVVLVLCLLFYWFFL